MLRTSCLRTALVFALTAVVAAALAPAARADGEIRLRGNYWRDRNTRVLAPEVSITSTLPSGTTIDAGYLLDAITSASASAGVLSDQPFTELRNEVGAGVSQRIGPATVGGRYRYSTESDYWAHTGGISAGVDLFKKNLSLAASYFYSHAEAAQRVSAVGYLWAAIDRRREHSQLTSHFAILSASQVLSRWALLEGAYELNVLNGFQANPYRSVRVAGTPSREVLPDERTRHSLTAGLRLTPLYRAGALHHLGLYLKYRIYFDDWGITSHAPEARGYLALGPVEIRLTGRYYTQGKADFYVDDVTGGAPLAPNYPNGTGPGTGLSSYANGGVTTRPNGSIRTDCPVSGCVTGDSKLSAFSSVFLEARVDLDLGFFRRTRVPLHDWLGGSRIGVSFGRYFNDHAARLQFGDQTSGPTGAPETGLAGAAYVGGVEIVTPL